jgi:hypothetical protein
MRLIALIMLLFTAGAALADWQTRSWSRWQIEETSASVVFGLERAELLRLRGSEDRQWLLQEVEQTLALSDGDGDGDGECALLSSTIAPASSRVLTLQLDFSCPQALRAPRVAVRAFLGAGGDPMHHARIRYAGQQQISVLLTRAEPHIELRPLADPGSRVLTLLRYLQLGFQHILAGLDHIAFLFCMLLVARGWAARVWMVTGFTIGHSVTLSLSVLGVVVVDTAAVEALIGFTVALLAAEAYASRLAGRLLLLVLLGLMMAALAAHAVLPSSSVLALLVLTPCYLLLARRQVRPNALHLGMAAVFGLVHGCGFASVLLLLGLPAGQSGWALAGFNLGVEAGQLLLLAGFAALLWLMQRLGGSALATSIERYSAAALCALGLYWLVERALG